MIEIHRTESDDGRFVGIVERIAVDLARESRCEGLHLIHVDNWFDHKWLGFAGKSLGQIGVWKGGEFLTIPAFNPNRVLSERYFVRSGPDGFRRVEPPPTRIHRRSASGTNLNRRITGVAPGRALLWFSGRTRANRRGAIMAYVPGDVGHDTWYASLSAGDIWMVDRSRGIAEETLESLLERVEG